MGFEGIIGILMLATLAGGNAVATRLVLRDKYTEQRQKAFQLLAVWLVPILGMIFVYALHRQPEAPAGRYRDIPDPGDDFGTSRQVGQGIRTHADD
jgi:hypothetical protein